MTNTATNASVGDAAEEFGDGAALLVTDTAGWISTHWLQIAIAAGIGTLIALFLVWVKAFGHKLVGDDPANAQWRAIIGRALSRTSFFFIVMVSAELVSRYADTPPTLARTIQFLFIIAAAFQAAIWAREFILGFIAHRVGDDQSASTLGSAIGLIRVLVSIALFAIALIVILDNLGVNVTGLVAGLGIGGIAIGLAAQGIFKDLFASLSIIFDKPFRRGDGIKFNDISGSVENIGLKTTRIRALSGEQVVVSNAILLDQEVHNFAQLHHRRIVMTLGVIYQTPPEVCAHIPDMLREIVESHEDARLVRCGMTQFGASSLDYELQFDVHSTDYEKVFMTRHAICIAILTAFNADGIEFAYPTQTSFTAAPDGSAIMPYPDVQAVTDVTDRGKREKAK